MLTELNVAQDTIQWLAFVDTDTELPGFITVEELTYQQAKFRFSKSTVLYETRRSDFWSSVGRF